MITFQPNLKNFIRLKIDQRIKYKILMIIFKAMNGQMPQYITDMFMKPMVRSLRSQTKNNLFQPRTNNANLMKKSIRVAGVKLWNDLPSLKNCSTVDAFKSGLKTHLFVCSYEF